MEMLQVTFCVSLVVLELSGVFTSGSRGYVCSEEPFISTQMPCVNIDVYASDSSLLVDTLHANIFAWNLQAELKLSNF